MPPKPAADAAAAAVRAGRPVNVVVSARPVHVRAGRLWRPVRPAARIRGQPAGRHFPNYAALLGHFRCRPVYPIPTSLRGPTVSAVTVAYQHCISVTRL